MKKKGHTGSVRINRQEGSLRLKVTIGGKAAGDTGAVRDLKQLSGGERSFATVAFTLALGGSTDMPFR